MIAAGLTQLAQGVEDELSARGRDQCLAIVGKSEPKGHVAGPEPRGPSASRIPLARGRLTWHVVNVDAPSLQPFANRAIHLRGHRHAVASLQCFESCSDFRR